MATRSLLRAKKGFVESSVVGPERFAAFLDAGMGDIDTTIEETEYLLADVVGLTDVEGAEVLECSREAFRQRVSRGRRTLRRVIDDRCGLVDPANPCRCGRQIASSEETGILRRDRLPLVEHPREEVRVWIEPLAKQLDEVVAIGDLYRFDRFAAPAELWEDLQARYPELLAG